VARPAPSPHAGPPGSLLGIGIGPGIGGSRRGMGMGPGVRGSTFGIGTGLAAGAPARVTTDTSAPLGKALSLVSSSGALPKVAMRPNQ
jgi:hypothetical protein